MPQVNLYMPVNLQKEAQKAAKKAGLSLSAWLTKRVEDYLHPKNLGWPKDFFTQCAGSWKGDFPEIEDLPFAEREGL